MKNSKNTQSFNIQCVDEGGGGVTMKNGKKIPSPGLYKFSAEPPAYLNVINILVIDFPVQTSTTLNYVYMSINPS
jgi:hypothetical protein